MTALRAPSIFNWAGSKSRVGKFLSSADLPEFGTYHEPFLGSGAVFLALATAGRMTDSHLADTNARIVNVFRAVQRSPDDVVSGLNLHSLLDSDVHFSAVLGRLNQGMPEEAVDPGCAADTIYLLAQSFHSTWYETLEGMVSMSRRQAPGRFRPRRQDVIRASALLENATVERRDFRGSLERVESGDLVFLDPPYLYSADNSDRQGYNADRFTTADFDELINEVWRLEELGAHVVFCWCAMAADVLPRGRWTPIGRDHVWVSQGLISASGWPPVERPRLTPVGRRGRGMRAEGGRDDNR